MELALPRRRQLPIQPVSLEPNRQLHKHHLLSRPRCSKVSDRLKSDHRHSRHLSYHSRQRKQVTLVIVMASKRKTSDEESIVLEPSTTQLPVVATTRTPATTHPKKKKTSSKETSKKQTSIQSNGITQEEVKRSKDQKHRGTIRKRHT